MPKSLSCKAIHPLLYDYATQKLAPATRETVREHLETCQECRRQLRELASVIRSLDGLKMPGLPEEFQEHFLARLQARTRPRKRPPAPSRPQTPHFAMPWLVRITVAAIVVLVLLLPVYLGRERLFEKGETEEGLPIQVLEAENPIVVITQDTDATLEKVKGFAHQRQGEVLLQFRLEKGWRITLDLNSEWESELFGELERLGQTSVPREGYRDPTGKLVILIVTE